MLLFDPELLLSFSAFLKSLIWNCKRTSSSKRRTQLTVRSEKLVASSVFLHHLGGASGLLFLTLPIKIVMYITNNTLAGALDSFSLQHCQF